MNRKEMLAQARKEAKKCGLTLKMHRRLTINGEPAYYLCKIRLGIVLIENMTLESAYNNLMSGYASIVEKTNYQKRCIKEAFSRYNSHNNVALYLYDKCGINVANNDLTYAAEEYWFEKCAESEQGY